MAANWVEHLTASSRVAALTAALLVLPNEDAFSQVDFNGKTIKLYIGTGPGGGYDTYGRLVAKHIGRHIAGSPSVRTQNLPGASSLTLTNFLFNTAPRDGTAMGIINQAMPTEQYLDIGNTNYELKTIQLDRPSHPLAVEMAIVWHTVPINSIEDVRHRETLMGGTGPTSGTVFGPYLLNNLAGMKFKVISGFNGTNEIALAMQRGEVEGSATPLESLTSYRADWVRDRKIKILVQYTAVRDPEVADIPTMVELGRTEEDRQILGYYASSADVGRSIVAPPGIPADTVTALRRAFDTMLADPVFLEDVKKMGIQLKPLPGEHLQEIIMQVANFPQSLIKKARQAREKPN